MSGFICALGGRGGGGNFACKYGAEVGLKSD